MTEPVANILMVDDRPENLLALDAILSPLGQNLVRAESGREALKQLLKHDFALILLDVQMPGMDGFETATLIKERDRSKHIPIIFVTAISKEESYVFQGYSAGAVDYIGKPFNAEILLSKVSVFVDLWKRGEQIKQQSELLRQTEQRELELEAERRERQAERRHTEELKKSEAQLASFKSTLDLTLDCVLMFEPQTLKFSYVNHGALQQLGFDSEEMLNMTPLDIGAAPDEASFRALLEALQKLAQDGRITARTYEATHKRKNGELYPVEVSLQFIALRDKSSRFVAVVRDISERKKIEAGLVQAHDEAELARAEAEHARDEAERANLAKSEFISSVSHELRTPLNAIIGFSKLLLNPRIGPLNEDQKDYMTDVVQGAEHLLQLINDILDIAKIEAGKLVLNAAPFVLSELLEQSLTIVREKALAHNLSLKTDFADRVLDLPPVVADQRKVKQIMYNLLSNAVKFTPDGGTVSVVARLEEDENQRLVISVKDSGIGIPEEDQERVFGAFEQVDSSYARQQQGTGLGLALTRRIVELHGGEIWLQSAPDEGSTFSFSLPLILADEDEDDEDADDADAQTNNHEKVAS